jgi:hypothetical protein
MINVLFFCFINNIIILWSILLPAVHTIVQVYGLEAVNALARKYARRIEPGEDHTFQPAREPGRRDWAVVGIRHYVMPQLADSVKQDSRFLTGALNLLEQMLSIDPSERPSAEALLRSDFFQEDFERPGSFEEHCEL